MRRAFTLLSEQVRQRRSPRLHEHLCAWKILQWSDISRIRQIISADLTARISSSSLYSWHCLLCCFLITRMEVGTAVERHEPLSQRHRFPAAVVYMKYTIIILSLSTLVMFQSIKSIRPMNL